MAALDRDELLATLSLLKDDTDDVTAAAAGRAASEMLTASGLDWPDVILAAPALSALVAARETGAAALRPETIDAAKNSADALVLIEQLLARDGFYEGTRAELTAYRDDIAAGEFDDGDLAYLNALYARVVMGGAKSSGD